ncbi:MAG: ribonucleotide-diphosphate reductase subunit beta [Bacillus thermozeamaize]|uniref:R2-like ligand binding oxidase n=1 Tax=Bacillus thermozeamaize TaxID=230954 RepID=A0A1Y3PW37_9BACI|nr:MAG: ribonucleotide-diphosphate reductase subunit beta [Bacillus thermozeamaize]
MIHVKFQTVVDQINWDAPMYRLYEKAKRNGKWNPADIDFRQDQEDFQKMSADDKMTAVALVSSFSAGEEAVTLDILPMIQAMARQGRLEDTLFLTTFLHDEAKHTEMFSRWQAAVGVGHMDLSVFHSDSYKRIFYEELPRAMDRLHTDDSPEAVIRAAAVYNLIVEGTLAETGYYAFRQIFKRAGLLPGILEGIDYLNLDEGRHIQFGIYTIQRLIAGNDSVYQAFVRYMEELWPHAFGVVEYLTSLAAEQRKQKWTNTSLVIDPDLMKDYANKQYHIRMSKIERARKYENAAQLDAVMDIDEESA